MRAVDPLESIVQRLLLILAPQNTTTGHLDKLEGAARALSEGVGDFHWCATGGSTISLTEDLARELDTARCHRS